MRARLVLPAIAFSIHVLLRSSATLVEAEWSTANSRARTRSPLCTTMLTAALPLGHAHAWGLQLVQ